MGELIANIRTALAGKIANLLGAQNRAAVVHAVAGVDLDVQAGEVIGGFSGRASSSVRDTT